MMPDNATRNERTTRRHPWPERINAPLAQPEVERAQLEVNYNYGVRILVPEETPEIAQEVAQMAREVLALATCVDPGERGSYEDFAAIAELAGVWSQERLDGYAPLPAERHSPEWYDAARKRRRLLTHELQNLEVHRVSRMGVPGWVAKATAHNGWLLLVNRMVDAVADLADMRARLATFRDKVQERAKVLKPGCARPDVDMPAERSGGNKQEGDRAYAADLALYLRDPDVLPAPEWWTPAELAALFGALGFNRLATPEAAKELVKQHQPAWEHRARRRRDPLYFPHLPKPPAP